MFVDLWEGVFNNKDLGREASGCFGCLQGLMKWFCAPAMVKQEPDEQAESIRTAKRPRISQDNPEISRPSFQSRLTEWSDQCLRFQASGEKWVPTKPCCPASPFLGLEACLLQGCKKQAATACVQLLSIEELCELHQFFCKNPRHALFERQPEFSSGSTPGPHVICMKVRPWMPDLPTELWVGNGFLLAQDGMLQLSPTGAAFAIPCREASESVGSVTECDEKPSEAVVQRPTKKRTHDASAKKLLQKPVGAEASGSTVSGVCYYKQSRKWRVNLWDPAIKKLVFGGYFAVKEEAEAKARELANKIRRRPRLSGSTVTGVYYNKRNQKWYAQCWDPAINKKVFGGCFAVMEEAEAKARELALKIRGAGTKLGRRAKEVLVEKAEKKAVAGPLQQRKNASCALVGVATGLLATCITVPSPPPGTSSITVTIVIPVVANVVVTTSTSTVSHPKP